MSFKSVLIAAVALAGVAAPGVAAAQRSGYPAAPGAYGYQGDPYRYHDRREERFRAKERRREAKERYREWKRTHRYGYDGYSDGYRY